MCKTGACEDFAMDLPFVHLVIVPVSIQRLRSTCRQIAYLHASCSASCKVNVVGGHVGLLGHVGALGNVHGMGSVVSSATLVAQSTDDATAASSQHLLAFRLSCVSPLGDACSIL